MSLTFSQHLAQQRAFSEATFGPGQRSLGVIAHIRKELDEIEADPSDVVEWVDIMLLSLDGTWRAGHDTDATWAALQSSQVLEKDLTLDPALRALLRRAPLVEDGDAFNALQALRARVDVLALDPTSLAAWVAVFAAAASGGLLAAGTPDRLFEAFRGKFEKNRSRVWPDWRTQSTDGPIEHDRSHD
jgi:hypothetical protein